MQLANAEHCTDDARLRALARLGELISGCMMELESRRPAPPKTDPPKGEEIYHGTSSLQHFMKAALSVIGRQFESPSRTSN
jgi:hypothetical protein